jgi:hypothetical protein
LFKKTFSILSAVFFVIAVFPILAGLTSWGNDLFVSVLSVSVFLPFGFSVAGLVLAFLGVKGKTKFGLVLLNSAGAGLSLFLIFVATMGFQQP